MKIQMKGLCLGPALRLEPGGFYEVDDGLGRQLVAQREALSCEPDDGPPAPETAEAPAGGETAEKGARRKARG